MLFRCVLVFLFTVLGLFAGPPNILFCISDDQSYAHTGANGDPVVKTPAFDRVAREGIRFTHAFCDAPTCGPSRSAILTGQPIWRLEEAGNIHSTLPKVSPEKDGARVVSLQVGVMPILLERSLRRKRLNLHLGICPIRIMHPTSRISSAKLKRISRFVFGWELMNRIAGLRLELEKDRAKIHRR